MQKQPEWLHLKIQISIKCRRYSLSPSDYPVLPRRQSLESFGRYVSLLVFLHVLKKCYGLYFCCWVFFVFVWVFVLFPVTHCRTSIKELIKHLTDFCKLKMKMFHLGHCKVLNFNFKLPPSYLILSQECSCPISYPSGFHLENVKLGRFTSLKPFLQANGRLK